MLNKTIKFAFIFSLFFIILNSCKKEKSTEELLTSGKWYYDFVDNQHNSGNDDCFNETNFIEFGKNGSFTATSLGKGNYTLSEDGKTVNIALTQNVEEYTQWKGTIHLIKEDYLRITFLAIRDLNQDWGYEITLVKNRSHLYCYKN